MEPFRKDGKNQHNKLYYFGRLTDDELKRINYALDILKNCKIEEPKLEDILFNNHWRFLDVTFLNFIWEQWGIAKILTIYRCLDPGSYLSAVEDKKKDIENYLYTTLKERDADSLRFVFYYLTDSYFEGRNCELATPGRT